MVKRPYTWIPWLAVGLGLVVMVSQADASSRYCGKVHGARVYAHNVSCHRARHVYRADIHLRVLKHWVCSASLRRCYRGHFGSRHWISWHDRLGSRKLLRSRHATVQTQGSEAKLPAPWRDCGDGLPRYNYFDLRAQYISCHYARRSANHHFRTGDHHFHGWRCHDRLRGEAGKTRCLRRKHGHLQAFKYFFGV
jgi:hypothetical protein